jgi:serine protease Do
MEQENNNYSYNNSENGTGEAMNNSQTTAQAGTPNPEIGNPYQQRTYYQNTGNTYQSSTGSYQTGTNAYQNSTGSYQTGANTNAYQSSTGSYQTGTQNGANTNAYQNSTGSYQTGTNAYQTSGGSPRKPKEKKKGGFGTKLVKCAALALVFGLVGGTAFEGVRYASGQLFPDTVGSTADSSSVSLTQNTGGGLETTQVSDTYVATGVADIVDQTTPSIVAITNISETEYRSFWGGGTQTYESTSAGSGIIVGQDDNYLYIATNNHVVEGATSLTVAFNDGSTVSAEIKGTDPSTDLAVIKVALSSIDEDTMDNIKVATLGDSDALRVGEMSIAIGNALGYGQSTTVGYISALNREVSVSDSSTGTNYTAELIQTDAAINPGNSGGALLNAKGEVIGINSVKYSDTSVEGIGYAIPINTAAPIIEDLITKEKVDESESAYLGIAGVDVEDDVASTYNMPTGVYVAQVVSGSAAEQAGIRVGDIITEFDGKTITSMEGLSGTLEYYKAGTTVDVTVKRANNGEYVEQTISVTLGRKN